MVQPMQAPVESPQATERTHLDEVLARLKQSGPGFARSSLAERIALAGRMLKGYHAVAAASVEAGCRAKGLDLASPFSAEEWLSGPTIVIRNLRLLMDTMRRLEHGQPAIDPGRVRTRPDGRVVVDVFPASAIDRVLFAGFSGEVWMQPGIKADEVPRHAAPHYRTPAAERQGRVSLILGAGNVASIPPTDALYKMFAEGKVCLIKMNPVNAYLGPFIERAFRSAIEQRLLAVCYGGADVGAYLVAHPLVDEVHITGSDKTHDLLVWGPPGPEREARKARKQPLLGKQITSELGNVSPVIVVPGPYSEAELTAQGHSIAAAVTVNASFNCNAAKLLVDAKGWPGRERLRRAIARSLELTPPRRAYYPGAESRWRAIVESHASAERIGTAPAGALPWAIIADLDPADAAEPCFATEPFCGVLSETALGQADPVAFLDEAVRFCNERVWGTLSATIVVHPSSLKEPRIRDAVERAIGDLRYGTIGINQWPALAYLFATMPWGGHPSATLEDIQSGLGWVHNTFMLEGIEKGVLRAPLSVKPKPMWDPGHRTAHRIGQRLVEMEAAPSWAKVPALLLDALRG